MRCLGAPEPWGPWARAQRAHWIRRPCTRGSLTLPSSPLPLSLPSLSPFHILSISSFSFPAPLHSLRGGWLVLITNGKSYMSIQLVPKSVTLNDLERRRPNGPYFVRYFTEFGKPAFQHINASARIELADQIRLL